LVAYLTVSEKVILEGEIDKAEAGKNKEKAEGHDQTIVYTLLA
jgi:hypothetical protein